MLGNPVIFSVSLDYIDALPGMCHGGKLPVYYLEETLLGLRPSALCYILLTLIEILGLLNPNYITIYVYDYAETWFIVFDGLRPFLLRLCDRQY